MSAAFVAASTFKVFALLFLCLSCATGNESNLSRIENDSCLLFFESLYKKKKWSCSGTFLNDNTLVTAAHCGEAFLDSGFQLDEKNRVFGYCRVNGKQLRINANSFLVHPKYSFNDLTTNAYDIALLKIDNQLSLSLSSQLLVDKVQIRELVRKNKCFIAGYRDTLEESEIQNIVKTPRHFIYLKSVHKKGVSFQMKFDANKAIVHGGVAEQKIANTKKESLMLRYPGSGYSGSALLCKDGNKKYKLGVYVGGFKNSKSWVSLLFLDEISAWILEGL